MANKGIIEEAMMELISEHRFYAELLLCMKREVTDKVPTLGVSVTDTVNLYVNPLFWGLYDGDIDSQVYFLMHECHHVLGNHFERADELEPDTFKDMNEKTPEERLKAILKANRLNVSMDMDIHEYIPNMPKEVFVPDKDGNKLLQPDEIPDKDGNMIKNPDAGKPVTGRLCFVEDLVNHYDEKRKKNPKLPQVDRRQMFEYYYHLLEKEQKQQQKKQGEGQGGQGQPQGQPQQGDGDGDFSGSTLDDHNIWQENNPDKEYVKEKIRQTVNKAVERAGGAGKVPGNILQLIDALNHKPKNWKRDIRKFPALCAETYLEPSRSKRNRRYGIMYPGYRLGQNTHLVAAFDSSGSMRDEQLEQIAAELTALHKNEVKITVLEFDTQVQSVFEYEPTDKLEIKGRGGTAFKPVFDHIESNEFKSEFGAIDGVVFFTDGDNWDKNDVAKPKYPVLWAMNEGCKKPYPWGWSTEVKIVRKNVA